MSTEHDFGAQRKRDVLKMFVMIIRLKYFCDSLNIVVILASGHEFFSANCVHFPLTFTERN